MTKEPSGAAPDEVSDEAPDEASGESARADRLRAAIRARTGAPSPQSPHELAERGAALGRTEARAEGEGSESARKPENETGDEQET